MRTRDKESFWRWVFQDQAQSELTVTGYCRQSGLQTNEYYRWKRRLKDRDQEKVDGGVEFGETSSASFVEVQVKSATGSAPPAGVKTSAQPTCATIPAPTIEAESSIKPISSGQMDTLIAACGDSLELRLPRGRSLLVRPGFDAATLSRLLVVLEGGPC